tara:strand:- start:9447 stop:10166 length:720 start_codon:yes stop_codon:yes gene_type:complete
MKGVILAGGTGSRLHPLTHVTNKHLLPVGKKPMILHLVSKLTTAGISDIMVITGTEHMGDMISLLGSGNNHGCSFTFKVQDGSAGIADALRLAESFVKDEKFIVLLGDNIFEDDLATHVNEYKNSDMPCSLFLKKVPDPERYGVAVIKEGKVVAAIEKPQEFISDLCITGIYMYDNSVFDRIRSLKPSSRGEYEITELNHGYIEDGLAGFTFLEGWWTDAGTFTSYHKANMLMHACDEE